VCSDGIRKRLIGKGVPSGARCTPRIIVNAPFALPFSGEGDLLRHVGRHITAAHHPTALVIEMVAGARQRSILPIRGHVEADMGSSRLPSRLPRYHAASACALPSASLRVQPVGSCRRAAGLAHRAQEHCRAGSQADTAGQLRQVLAMVGRGRRHRASGAGPPSRSQPAPAPRRRAPPGPAPGPVPGDIAAGPGRVGQTARGSSSWVW